MVESMKDKKGFIFATSNSSQEECFHRLLFGSNRQYGAAAIRVKKGDLIFLLNLDSDLLYGIFEADSEGKMNIESEAWNGKYPYQVKVHPIGKIVPLKDAKKLLKQLGISRSSPINMSTTKRLIELYRPSNLSMEKSYEFFLTTKKEENQLILEESKSWSFLSPINGKNEEIVEEIPHLEATTLWDFPRQSYGKIPKGDNKYPGVTPAALIWNLIWRYTDPDDLVVDPMCGSGTTLDVCREEQRRAICFDIAPTRPDVIQNDARKIPLSPDSVDLVFVDSPYGDNIRYNEHPDDIGKISSEDEVFYDELEKVIDECYRILKPGKVLGWLIGDQWVKKKFTSVGFKLYERLCKKFETVDVICIVRRGQSSHTGVWFNRALRFNFYLRGFKYLFIMRKPSPDEKISQQRNVTWTFYERNKKNPKKK